ncbi:MAG: T9SS type A sorting domain-containing protein [Bacteroidia bacterium]
MRKALSIFFMVFVYAGMASAQHHKEIPCFTDEMLTKAINENPALLQTQTEHEDALYNRTYVANKRSSSGCDVRIIPTVFHIIHNNGSENISDEIVNQYVQQVNDVWRFQNVDIEDVDTAWQQVVTDMQVELRLAKFDENGDSTSGIVRIESSQTSSAGDNVKSLSQWDPDRYLNIYVVRTIANSGSGTILGYAYFPWMESSTRLPGIMIRSDVLNRQTLAHELGHYLDLYHPFQNSCGDNCRNTGDRVCDTPPVNAASRGCNKLQNTCHQDVPNKRDMIENIMDYSDCRTILTAGQKVRVDNTFQEYRSELISVDNLYKTGVIDSNQTFGAPVAKFETEATVICEGAEIDFKDLSCTNKDSTDYKWFFPSGTPSAAFTSDPTVTYSKTGKYDVTLIISNNAGADTMELKEFITVTPKVSDVKAPLMIDFEDTGFPYEGWSLQNADDDLRWKRSTRAAADGEACLTIQNFASNKNGEQYIFRTPPIDLSSSKSYELNFDLAYARLSQTASERLEVYAVDACREVELLRYSGTASSMRSIEDLKFIAFLPNETEWKTFNVDMSIAKSLTAASIEFRFTSFGEQNIYLDNLAIGSWPSGITSKQNSVIEAYPNPATDKIFIKGISDIESASIIINDLSGRTIANISINTQNEMSIDISSLEKGVYLLQIQSENQVYSKQIIKE